MQTLRLCDCLAGRQEYFATFAFKIRYPSEALKERTIITVNKG
ncbi:MAG TPA: hypothetical protein VGE58_10320 [Daejeonella sp.]